VVYLVHRREDVSWTGSQLPAVICSTGENAAIVEEEHGMELSARNFDDTSASKDPNTYLTAQVQAPTPDVSNRIDRKRVRAPPGCDTNHTT